MVRSFTEFLDKFEKDFGTETLQLAKRHKRSWDCLIYCYTRNIPINPILDFDGYMRIEFDSSIWIGIRPTAMLGDRLSILSHEVTHCKDYWGIPINDYLKSSGAYIKFIINTEINAIIEQSKSCLELMSLNAPVSISYQIIAETINKCKTKKEVNKYILNLQWSKDHHLTKFYHNRMKEYGLDRYRQEFVSNAIIKNNDLTYTY